MEKQRSSKKAAPKRPKAKFGLKEKVLLVTDFGDQSWKETKYVHKRTWREGVGYVYDVGSILGVKHRGGLATVLETSLSKHP